jgi:hypothetical protein
MTLLKETNPTIFNPQMPFPSEEYTASHENQEYNYYHTDY